MPTSRAMLYRPLLQRAWSFPEVILPIDCLFLSSFDDVIGFWKQDTGVEKEMVDQWNLTPFVFYCSSTVLQRDGR